MAKILVIDKNLRNESPGLDENKLEKELEHLKKRGYTVITADTANNLEPNYDLIIAHPSTEDSRKIKEYHKTHPDIPIIIHSLGNSWRRGEYIEDSKYCFDKDNEGIYINFFGCKASHLISFLENHLNIKN